MGLNVFFFLPLWISHSAVLFGSEPIMICLSWDTLHMWKYIRKKKRFFVYNKAGVPCLSQNALPAFETAWNLGAKGKSEEECNCFTQF